MDEIPHDVALRLACPHVQNRGENPLCIASQCMAWRAPVVQHDFIRRAPDAEGPDGYEDMGTRESSYLAWRDDAPWWKFWQSSLEKRVQEYRLWRSPEPVEQDGYCVLNQE